MSDERVADLLRNAAGLLQSGDFHSALQVAQDALRLDPASTDAYSLVGMAQARLGRAAEAEVALRTAADISPDAKAFYNLASHLFATGDRLAAEEFARRALAVDPLHETSRELLARLEAERDEPLAPPTTFAFPTAPTQPPKPFYFVQTLGWAWTLAGCFLAAASVITRVVTMLRIGRSAPSDLESMTQSEQTQWAMQILTENGPLFVGAFVWLALLAVWWIIDYAHWQRRNLLFYVIAGLIDATILMCCTYGVLHGALFAVYLYLSRRPPAYPQAPR
jgi:tetratricopeptide (TPR) repeat protein